MGQLNDSMQLVNLPMVNSEWTFLPAAIWGDYCNAQASLYGTLCELSSRDLMIPSYLKTCRVLVVPDHEAMAYLEEQMAFARSIDRMDNLAERLYFLVQSGRPRPTRTVLFRDFAPHSFIFTQQQVDDSGQKWVRTMNGGLIYSGPDQPLDGSAPAYTVSLNDSHVGWSTHT